MALFSLVGGLKKQDSDDSEGWQQQQQQSRCTYQQGVKVSRDSKASHLDPMYLSCGQEGLPTLGDGGSFSFSRFSWEITSQAFPDM